MDSVCSSLSDLNDQCLVHIFGFASGRDRICLELVCRRWKELSRGNRWSWRSYRTFDITDKHLGYQFQLQSKKNTASLRLCTRIFSTCFSYLTRINLSAAESFGESDVLDLTHCCFMRKQLGDVESEKLSRKKSVTLNDLIIPLANFENIEELCLCSCVVGVNDEILKKVFINNKNLRLIALSNYELTGECFSYLPLEFLESIAVDWCTLDNEFKDPFGSSAPKLRTLSVRDGNYSDFGSMIISSSPNLVRLILIEHYDLPESFLPGTCNCKNLTLLVLRNIGLYDQEMLLIIESCKKIDILDVSNNEYLTDISLDKTRSLPHLKSLSIGFNENFSDAGLLGLSKDLLSLDLTSTKFSSDAILAILKKMLRLAKLDLDYLEQVNEKFVESAIDIVKLRPYKVPLEIVISNTSIVISKINNTSPLATISEEMIIIKPQMYAENQEISWKPTYLISNVKHRVIRQMR